ncbi:hypothetical protein N4239_09340 [Brachyspira hyodysenteriae]|uniref:hypothetical protein n=1 Tax=Brachyspira hyodysenteriae TaxID=159 RepID=UPI002B263269|nr:hypothetical protein [Brachyspira hyodysenteriae]WPC23141.1 hypothetical protein N4239_09340 [Brachyspira hyodysenteriae]
MFEIESKYYQDHKKEFREKYLGKHLVISGNELKGVYDNDREAFDNAILTMKPGTFMIKIVTAKDEDEWRSYSRAAL